MPVLRNTLEITGVISDTTLAQVETIIVAASAGGGFDHLHMDDTSYNNFKISANINVGSSASAKATSLFSASQGQMLIINAFPSLMQQYKATPFPKP